MSNTLNTQDVIIAAAEAGYFRSKSVEKKNTISEEICKANDWELTAVLVILNAETQRRSDEYRKREAAKVKRAEKEAQKPVSAGTSDPHAHIVDAPPADVYVITTAQNNTDVCPVFLAALEKYAEIRGANIMVAKTTYNKNGFQNQGVDAEDLWYDPKIAKYLVTGHIRITNNLHFFADANVLPTAKRPLSGFEGVTPAGVDCIIPAVKISLQCVASLKGARGKVLHSTGAVTLRNYILRKAGAVAQAEHNMGALVVEILPNGSHNVRQLEMMPGANGFYDEGNFYNPAGMQSGYAAAALQFGDIHAEKMTNNNLLKIIALIETYRPQNIMIHDVLDFSSRNHHNIKDPTFIFQTLIKGDTVENDLVKVAQVLDEIVEAQDSNGGGTVHVIESNHDLAINTWLKNADFKQDPANAKVYLQCMLAWYEHMSETPDEGFNMLEYAYREIGGGQHWVDIHFHETDESVIIAGVEMGCHGHTGINGAKGSPVSFRKLGVPMNTGHTHTPSIEGAVYTAGVSASLEMGYNVGPSSWHLAHVLTWPNGQRQIIFS